MTTIKSLLESGVITMETRVLGTLPTTQDGAIVGESAMIWRVNDHGEPYSYPICVGWAKHIWSSKEAALAAQAGAKEETP